MRRLVFSCLAIATLSGVACSERPATETVTGGVRVRIPVVDDQGVQSLSIVTLGGISDLSEVKGRYAQFTFAPKITPTGLEGVPPRARFVRTADGVFVPSDTITQEMAFIYGEFEKLFELDRASGIGDVLSWPRQVGVSVRMKDRGVKILNNSFYDGESDALLVVPYASGRLPLGMNPGVIAHEHFHALFHHVVIKPLLAENRLSRRLRPSAHGENRLRTWFTGTIGGKIQPPEGTDSRPELRESDAKLVNSVLVKAMNEGLADVWGWIHTGDPSFIGHSLPQFLGARTLKPTGFRNDRLFPTRREFEIAVDGRASVHRDPENALNDFSYVGGTSLARAVLQILGAGADGGIEHRRAVARRLVKALPAITEEMRSDAGSDLSKILDVILAAEPLTESQQAEAILLRAARKGFR